MNFSLYKTDYNKYYKKYLVLSLLFVSLIIGFFRCVGIEDLLPPTIGNFTLQANYNVTDTIFIDANLFDNFALGQVSVDIEPIDPNGNFRLNKVLKDNVGARLLKLERFNIVVIPATATLGEYKMTLTVTDVVNDSTSTRAANQRIIEQNFMVGADNEDPSFDFPDNILPTLDSIGVNQYKICRADTLKIRGLVRDNIQLRSVELKLINTSNNVVEKRVILDPDGKDSLNLTTAFVIEPLTIPSTLRNGTQLSLEIIATDTQDNANTFSGITILVNCDDQSPVIESIITNLDENINEDREIEVIEGQELFITGGIVTDKREAASTDNDGSLKDVFVYFDSQENLPFIQIEDIIASRINIVSSNNSILVPIPSNAQKLDMYKIILVVTDTAGNLATKEELIIRIIENDPPDISKLNTFQNIRTSQQSNLSDNQNNQAIISAGSSYRLLDKIEDKLGLQYYSATWQKIGSPQISIIGELDNINSTTVQFSSAPQNQNVVFTVEENTIIDTEYILTIYARDIAGKENERKYYFKVQ